jgi:hypothetical protein
VYGDANASKSPTDDMPAGTPIEPRVIYLVDAEKAQQLLSAQRQAERAGTS